MENKLSFTDFLSININNNFSLQIQFLKLIIFFILIYLFELTINSSYNGKQIYINQKIYNVRIEEYSFHFSYFNYSGNIIHLSSFLKTKEYSKFNNSLLSIDLDNFKKSIDFIILNFEKTKIDNIFMLIIIFPFLKENSTILYQIDNRKKYNLYTSIFKGVRNTKNFYILYLNDLINFIDNFTVFFFDWEVIPNNYLINNMRYIINNYYNETLLNIFDKSLNLNLKRYIKTKNNNLTLNELNILMSK